MFSMDRQRFSSRKKEGKSSDNNRRSTKRESGSAVSDRYSRVDARDEYSSRERAVTVEEDIEKVSRGNAILEGDVFGRSPPSSSLNGSQSSPRSGSRSFLLQTNSDVQPSTVRGSRLIGARRRTGTLENRQSLEHISSMLRLKSRHHIGSVHSAGSSLIRGQDENPHSSIGHPSSAPPPSPASSRQTDERPTSQHRLSMSQTRNLLSMNRRSATHSSDQSYAPTNDKTRIVALMRYTCGRMQGNLSFRREGNTSWSSAYCYINEESGSLTYEPKSDVTFRKTLVPDLRSCHVNAINQNGVHFLEIANHTSSIQVQLRATTQKEVDLWYAALLTWQPIRPRGLQNRMSKPQAVTLQGRRLASERHYSTSSSSKNSAIIKVGKMRLFENRPSSRYPVSRTSRDSLPSNSDAWIKISCTLRENGELNIYTDQHDRKVTLYATIQLSHLPRSSVQLLDPSLGNDFCVAIYPQRSPTSSNQAFVFPILLSYETRILCEVWFVLLKVLCTPELYGPREGRDHRRVDGFSDRYAQFKNASHSHMFRMDRSMSLRIIEAKLQHPKNFTETEKRSKNRHRVAKEVEFGFYAEVYVDGDLRGKTTLAYSDAGNTFWLEGFDFVDLPATLSNVRIVVKARRCSWPVHESKLSYHLTVCAVVISTLLGMEEGGLCVFSSSANALSLLNPLIYLKVKHRSHPEYLTDPINDIPGSPDLSLGQVNIYIDELESNKEVEQWWSLTNNSGQIVGEVLIRIHSEEVAILMAREYQPLSELLHHFSNGVTLQIAQMMPSHLRKLSDILLDIFQVSGQATEWLMVLIEEEIDGARRETSIDRLRLSRRLGSAESDDSSFSAADREVVLRDLGKSATLESAMLFRGNSLLTKSLDAHMKRLGKEYLDGVLGDVIREINMQDPDCEVDPSRVKASNDLDKNWRRLIVLTRRVWHNIRTSAAKCPPELRFIFRHIRACAEDRYGAFLRTVPYSSVSGFLFLRFFCPAILNPRLFGLLKENPKRRAHRTMTLIAKAIQGLGNMSSFGAKEVWMEPMNQFLTHHRQELKEFVEEVCSIAADRAATAMPPSYATPLTIMNRLSQDGFAQEGFPSLPYLIDHARSFAALVKLWIQHTTTMSRDIERSDGDVFKFHELCTRLNDKTLDCLNRAERAERPSSLDLSEWEEVVEKMFSSPAAILVQDDTDSALSMALPSPRGGVDTPPEPRTNGSTSFDGSTQFSPNISSSNLSVDLEISPHSSKPATRDKERPSRFGDFMAARRKARFGQ